MKPKYCEVCGKTLLVSLEPKGHYNPVTGIKEFRGAYVCPDRIESLFGLVSNGHSYFKGTYRGMGEFFEPFIFDANRNRIED